MGVARIAIAGSLAGTEVRNVFTVNSDAGLAPGSAAVAAWLTALYDTSGLLGSLTTALHFDRFYVEWLDSLFKWIFTSEGTLDLTGEAASDRVPNQIAAVVVGITPSRRRGKKFIPGITEEDVTGGVLQSTLVAYLENFGDTWIEGLNDGEATWRSGVVKKNSSDFLDFVTFRVDPYVGTQRQRKPGIGV